MWLGSFWGLGVSLWCLLYFNGWGLMCGCALLVSCVVMFVRLEGWFVNRLGGIMGW